MKRLQNLSDVDTNTKEGRYLMAALAKITTESQTDKTPDEVLEQCYLLQEEMYKDALHIPGELYPTRLTFQEELNEVINKHSMENRSNTPDFILGEHLHRCLDSFNAAVNERENWYGRGKKDEPIETSIGSVSSLKNNG